MAKPSLPRAAATLARPHRDHADNDPGVKDRVVFNLKRDFGRTADDIRPHVQFCLDRFPVDRDVT